MIAIPIKTNKENAVVSTLFGKSKWFAYIDENGNITIEDNKVILEPIKKEIPTYDLDSLLAKIPDDYEPYEEITGTIGKEEW